MLVKAATADIALYVCDSLIVPIYFADDYLLIYFTTRMRLHEL